MVTASMYARFLREQTIKEKKRREKEVAEQKYKAEVKKAAEERKLIRGEGIFQQKRRIRKKKIVPKVKVAEVGREVEDKIRAHEEFILTQEEKNQCRKKTIEELIEDIGSSKLVSPPGKEIKKEIGQRELTADLLCFRKRIRKKSPKEIYDAYKKLLNPDPERLCK